MEALANAKNWMRDRITPAMVQVKLRALALMVNHRPSFRHHLKDTHPVGTPFVFQAKFLFTTVNGDTNAHAIFKDGKMKVGIGPVEDPDLTVRFKGLDQMRAFFTEGADTFGMLLDNTLSFDGNMNYLFKFGHLSRAVTQKNRRLKPTTSWEAAHGPRRWQDLTAPPAGEPFQGEVPANEVTFLKEPYLARYTLDDFPRVKRLLWAYRTVQPEICSERPRLLTEFMLKHKANGGRNDPAVLRQGKALHHVLTRKQPIIRGDDLLAGTTTGRRIGVAIYPETGGLGIWPELLTVEARELNPYRISDEDVRILDREVFPFWMKDNIREWAKIHNEQPEVLQMDEKFVLYFMWKTQAVSHTVVDLPMVLSKGLADIREEARKKEAKTRSEKKKAFYQAVQFALDGVMDYARRLSLRAMALAEEESDPDREALLMSISETCEHVPARPARTLREAIQATWIVFLCQHMENMNAGLSIGRLDTWFQPYFEKDMEGVSDPAQRQRLIEEAIELVCAFMLKHTDHLPLVPDLGNRLFGGSSSNQVITLGGETPEGKSAVCDMTWIFLKATEMLRLRDPNMNARYSPGANSTAYLRRLCEVNLLSRATPALHNDAAMLPSLEKQGFPLEHARDWSATGCVEPTISGRHFGHTNSMMLNMVAPLEMTLHDGIHPLLGDRVGPRTGDPATFDSYAKFLAAYKEQLGWLIDRSVEANNMLGRAHQSEKPTPLLSALFQGPLDKGKDLVDGGALYNSSGTAMIGLTDVVDSLAAIKVLVYDAKQVDMATLLAALGNDFAEHETLRARIMSKVPKFGQGHDLPDRIAHDLMDFVFDRYQSQENYRGGKYLPGYWSMSNHVAFGTLSGALPSGRRKGQAFTPGLTPTHLASAPLTDQIRCVADLDALKMPNNIAFNVKVVPGADDTHQEILDRMTAYVASYFEMGGMQMQFNVMSTETLREAMKNPEGHRDLMVRISGYNAYFVELNRDIQKEVIERMEHALGS